MDISGRIVAGLGGLDNVVDLEPCATRLDVDVANIARVDEAVLRAVSSGILWCGNTLQFEVGAQADEIASRIITQLDHSPNSRSRRSPIG